MTSSSVPARTFASVAPLRPGSRVRIVAPSSPFDEASFASGVERLRTRYDVSFDQTLFTRAGFLAGDDARRLAELEAALSSDADAIVAARGGYGATRLLDALSVGRIAAAKKLLVGFSDVTALHALWARAGLRSIHGPMVATLGRVPLPLFDRFVRAVEGETRLDLHDLQVLRGGRAFGPLLGGNLAVLVALLGTPHFPPLDGAVLFLEDVGEKPYRVDRMLTQLKSAGIFDRLAAVALGGFTEAAPNADGVTIDVVLAERLSSLPCPVVAGVPAGHLDDNLELPFGAIVHLDGGTLRA